MLLHLNGVHGWIMQTAVLSTDAGPFVRAFVAVEIDDAARDRLEGVIALLKKTNAHVAWVPAANLHLSLVFLGNVRQETIPLIATALDEAARQVTCFAFDVVGLGWFGSERSPRVIWAGVRAPEALGDLQSRVTANLKALGLAFDERPFRAHITLGRLRSPRGREQLLESLASLRDREFGRVEATEIVLMKSRLLPQGAEYSVLHRARCQTGWGA